MKTDSSPDPESLPISEDVEVSSRLPCDKPGQPAGPEDVDAKTVAPKAEEPRNAFEKARYYWALSRF